MKKTLETQRTGARSGRFARGAGRSGKATVLVVAGVVLAGTVIGGSALLWTRARSANAGQVTPGGSDASGLIAGEAAGERIAGPEKLRELVTAATAYVAREEYAEAEAIYTSAIEQYPDDLDLRTGYAELLIGLERNEEAYRQLGVVLEEGEADAEMEFLAGTLAVSLERYDEASRHYAEAQKIEPGNPAYALLLGNEQMRAGDLDAALASFVRVTVLEPESARAWIAMAKVELRRNNARVALQHAERAIELDADEPAYRLFQARAMKRLGDPEGALLVLTGLDEAKQREAEYLKTIGECFGLLGRPEDAAARYSEAAEGEDPDGTLAFEAALWYQRAKQMDEARAWGERAAERGSERAERWLESL